MRSPAVPVIARPRRGRGNPFSPRAVREAGPAKKALPYCNIVFIAGEDLKARLGGYLAALLEQDPAAVGGALPGDDFYYVK